jgi:hypothetical protein
MSEGLARLHELVKDPTRRKILVLLDSSEAGLDFDGLMKALQLNDPEELHSQLKVLNELVMTTEDQYILSESGVSKNEGGRYVLTEKGHDALGEMLGFPEITRENYNPDVMDKGTFNRHKLTYMLGGAGAAACASFFGGIIVSIISLQMGGPAVGRFDAGWPFFGFVIFVAPVVGGLVGYWVGEKRNFKRPEPEWAQ